ncbi:MAG: hypothetical protein ACYC8T_28705 [Myxococcaceae bacterium]
MSEPGPKNPREKLDPTPVDRFEPEAYLEGGWRVVSCLPGRAVVLEQERGEQMRSLMRTAMAMAIPLVLAVMLILGTRTVPGDMYLVTYPLAGLFLAVMFLGLFALRRKLRRVTEGVRLEVDARSGKVSGMPEPSLELGQTLADFNARLVTGALDEVQGVRLVIHRGATDSARKRRALANLTLSVKVGGKTVTLEGPHSWAEDFEWFEARDALAPLACELARLARRPLVIDYRWQEKTFEVPLPQLDARPLPAAYELR